MENGLHVALCVPLTAAAAARMAKFRKEKLTFLWVAVTTHRGVGNDRIAITSTRRGRTPAPHGAVCKKAKQLDSPLS